MAWRVYLTKARNTLHTAQSAYAQGDYDSCASRAYFAVFQAEIAALVKLTPFRQDRWGHDQVQAEFNRRLIRSHKLFPASLQHMSARTAERCLRKATELVTMITSVLEEA